MGTVAGIAVCPADVRALGRPAVAVAAAAARAELRRMEHRFSHFRPDSQISRWQAGHAVDAEALADIGYVLARCEELRADSAGVFACTDPRTGRLDTAGFVKGYAIGLAAGVLRAHGLTGATVGVGGDLQAFGRPVPDRPWRVAVQDPARSHAVVAVLDVVDAAVATSGRAQRGEHIWGRDRAASADLLSLTVTGPRIAEADAYATTGFAMGWAGIGWVARHEGYHCIAVGADGRVLADAPGVAA